MGDEWMNGYTDETGEKKMLWDSALWYTWKYSLIIKWTFGERNY